MQKKDRAGRIEQARKSLRATLETQERFFSENWEEIADAFELVTETLRNGGKLLVAGNGGSAADAQHVAAELVNRYRQDRPALPAIALTTDSSILTAVGNDSDFRYVFSRQVEALGKAGDLLLAVSTSGNSPNVLEAVAQAGRMGIRTLALTGGEGGALRREADRALCVSVCDSTPRIQETLFVLEHLLCEWIESALFAIDAA